MGKQYDNKYHYIIFFFWVVVINLSDLNLNLNFNHLNLNHHQSLLHHLNLHPKILILQVFRYHLYLFHQDIQD